MKKRIVCYGDSNTWGWTPITMERYDESIRWPARLRTLLGPDYEVEEEGLPGRTTVFDDPLGPYYNGYAYMPTCLLTNAPIDLLIFMLGTNDFQVHLTGSAQGSARGTKLMLEEAQKLSVSRDGKKLPILLICPAAITEDRFGYQPNDLVTQREVDNSKELSERLAEVAKQLDCEYLDANDYIRVSHKDGMHYEPEAHIRLADVVAAKVKEMLG